MEILDCIFCKIINKEIPAKVAYEDEDVLAFHDINPQAPIHLLIIPKQHIASIMEINKEDDGLLNKVIMVAQKLAKQNNIDTKGFRIVVNTGDDGGQTVSHLHFHILGGRSLAWPPG